MPGVKDTTSFPQRQLGVTPAAASVMDRAEWLQGGLRMQERECSDLWGPNLIHFFQPQQPAGGDLLPLPA